MIRTLRSSAAKCASASTGFTGSRPSDLRIASLSLSGPALNVSNFLSVASRIRQHCLIGAKMDSSSWRGKPNLYGNGALGREKETCYVSNSEAWQLLLVQTRTSQTVAASFAWRSVGECSSASAKDEQRSYKAKMSSAPRSLPAPSTDSLALSLSLSPSERVCVSLYWLRGNHKQCRQSNNTQSSLFNIKHFTLDSKLLYPQLSAARNYSD